MGVHEGIGQLAKAMKALMWQWQESLILWNDPMSEKFGRDHLEPLLADLKRAEAAMDHAAKEVAAACHECD
jgi:hypothetical protein